jgi:phosphopantothenoylcysteine decarboxylase/phosphopantothenate--cysteine ligase
MLLRNKNILIGISGGIAVYKIAEVVRHLAKEDANVKVVMTKSATEFVAPLTFETLSNNPVHLHTFPKDHFAATEHIDLVDWADLILIAPATANIIGKMANGIGDDVLSTVMLAAHCPVVIAPAMNSNMWSNPAFQNNLKTLGNWPHISICPPESGFLACGYTGQGRLASLENIIHYLHYALTENSLTGKSILVTAGPTIEPIDPVRYITNHSSGRMGYAIAHAAWYRGANVTLLSGPTHLAALPEMHKIDVTTACEMYEAVMSHISECDIYIGVAAVADFKPKTPSLQKLKKDQARHSEMALDATEDIIAAVAKKYPDKRIFGFAMETENGPEQARQKLRSKQLTGIFLNDLNEDGAGFAVDTNHLHFYGNDGHTHELPMQSKAGIATQVLDLIQRYP